MPVMGFLAIAVEEFLRARGRLGIRNLVFPLALMGFLAFFLFSLKTGSGVVDGIYAVGTNSDEGVIWGSVAMDRRFRVYLLDQGAGFRLLRHGVLDIYVLDEGDVRIYSSGTDRSEGALSALEEAVDNYKLNMIFYVPMEEVNDAFPVWVQTHYLEREVGFQYTRVGGGGAVPREEIEELRPPPLNEASHAMRLESMRREQSAGTGLRALKGPSDVTLPSLLSPPVPLKTALMSFLFAIPLYLFAQLYSSGMLGERVSRTGQLLLASPLKPWEIIAGKTIPPFLYSMASMAAITLLVKGEMDVVVLLLLAPAVVFFLGLSFFLSVVSRSFKENSFLLITASVVFLAYLFFPAMFVDVHVASRISPMALVVERLAGEEVSLMGYLFSTLPLYLCAGLLFAYGGAMFRDEHLFAQKPVSRKLIEAVEGVWRAVGGGIPGVVLIGGTLVPAAYFLELILLGFLFQVPLPYSIAAMLILSGFIEEGIKLLPVMALYLMGKAGSLRLLGYGMLVGAGFFLGEKLLAFFTLAQIYESLFGAAIFIKAHLLKALALQMALTALSAVGVLWSRGRFSPRLMVFLAAASSLHAAYNARLAGLI